MLRSALIATGTALLTAGGATADIGRFEVYNGFDPTRPTIIATHGWFGTIDYPTTFGRSPSFAENANVLGWEWDAVVFIGITAEARQSGRELAQKFSTFIRSEYPDYDQPIQLVGHSLGTHVVLAAAAEFRDIGRDDPGFAAYQADQVTLVDTGFNNEIQAAINNITDDSLVELKLDNYWSPGGAGGTGQAYAGPITNAELQLDHGNMWYWYFTSLDDQPAGVIKPGGAYGLLGQFADLNIQGRSVQMVAGSETPLIVSDDLFRPVR